MYDWNIITVHLRIIFLTVHVFYNLSQLSYAKQTIGINIKHKISLKRYWSTRKDGKDINLKEKYILKYQNHQLFESNH